MTKKWRMTYQVREGPNTGGLYGDTPRNCYKRWRSYMVSLRVLIPRKVWRLDLDHCWYIITLEESST